MQKSRSRSGKTEQLTAFQRLQDQLKWVDLIFVVVDARLPASSNHPQADKIFGNKPRIVVMSKEDLADPTLLKDWLKFWERNNQARAVSLALKEQQGKQKLVSLAIAMTKDKQEALARKGILPRPMRACIVGMPNVGKSSFINWLIGQKKAAVGNKPGVTKGPQWVRVHPQLELLDTPGILPVNALTAEASAKLALFNLLPEGNYDQEDVAGWGLKYLHENLPRTLSHYGEAFKNIRISPEGMTTEPAGITYLEYLANARSCIASGGKLDTRRAAGIFLSDLRDGKLGRITLEAAPKVSD